MDSAHGYWAEIGADPAEIGAVRAAVRSVADDGGLGDRVSDLVLALDELLANAQEHGKPPITVRAWWDGRLIVEVADAGGGLDRAAIWRRHPPELFSTRGRGLWIVRQLSDLVSVDSNGASTRVRIEMTTDPQIGA